jgi:hypothetical protein
MTRLWVAASVAVAAVVLSFRPIYEPDLWWHLAQGREAVAGRLVRANVFSFNYADYRQHYTSWLFDAMAYLSWTAGGPIGIQLLQASLLALTFVMLILACRARAPAAWPAATVAVLILGFFVLEPRAIPRPHLVSFAGVACCAFLVERAAASRSVSSLWWTVPIVALWSNLHVECVFGLAVLAIYALSELLRPTTLARAEAVRATAIAAACGLATLLNPYGWGLFAYLYENLSVPQLLTIAELQPPPVLPYRAFYAYLALTVLLTIWRWRQLRLWEIAFIALLAALGLRYLRLTPLLLLVTAPMVAARLADLTPRRPARNTLLFAAACAGLLVSRIPPSALLTELTAGQKAVEPDAFFSQQAVAFVRQAGLRGPVFNSHNLGGYLAWTLYPDVRIFQDSRLQAYPPEHFLSILVASRSQPDWEVLVADVNWAVVSLPRPNQLSGVGRFPPSEWVVVFRDVAVEIVVRKKVQLVNQFTNSQN